MLLHIKVKADTAAPLKGLANTNGIVPFQDVVDSNASNAAVKSAEKLMTAQRAGAQEQYSRTMADRCAAYKPQGLISRFIRNEIIDKIGDQTSKTILG